MHTRVDDGRRMAGRHWYDVQDSTAKVLGSLASGSFDALGLVV